MVREAGCQGKLLVGFGKRVKYLHVEKCLLSMCPEVFGSYINPSFVLTDRCCVVEDFTTQWPKNRFETDIMTDLC